MMSPAELAALSWLMWDQQHKPLSNLKEADIKAAATSIANAANLGGGAAAFVQGFTDQAKVLLNAAVDFDAARKGVIDAIKKANGKNNEWGGGHDLAYQHVVAIYNLTPVATANPIT